MKKHPYLKLAILASIAAFLTGVFYYDPADGDAAFQRYSYRVVAEYPHDTEAYTQGLLISDGQLWESTGREGQSSVRRVDLATGAVTQRVDLPQQYFGEGIAILDGKIYQLTWKARKGFIYSADTLEQIGEFSYQRQGWGMTTDGHNLIMSDGTSLLRWLSPEDFDVIREIDVVGPRGPVSNLNELEYINGWIWANVWRSDTIVRIDPHTGRVVGEIDLAGILPPSEAGGAEVLNGIAYDAENDRIFVTGKLWPKLYEIEVTSPYVE